MTVNVVPVGGLPTEEAPEEGSVEVASASEAEGEVSPSSEEMIAEEIVEEEPPIETGGNNEEQAAEEEEESDSLER